MGRRKYPGPPGGRSLGRPVRSGTLTYVAEPALDDGDGNGLDRSFAVADRPGLSR